MARTRKPNFGRAFKKGWNNEKLQVADSIEKNGPFHSLFSAIGNIIRKPLMFVVDLIREAFAPVRYVSPSELENSDNKDNNEKASEKEDSKAKKQKEVKELTEEVNKEKTSTDLENVDPRIEELDKHFKPFISLKAVDDYIISESKEYKVNIDNGVNFNISSIKKEIEENGEKKMIDLNPDEIKELNLKILQGKMFYGLYESNRKLVEMYIEEEDKPTRLSSFNFQDVRFDISLDKKRDEIIISSEDAKINYKLSAGDIVKSGMDNDYLKDICKQINEDFSNSDIDYNSIKDAYINREIFDKKIENTTNPMNNENSPMSKDDVLNQMLDEEAEVGESIFEVNNDSSIEEETGDDHNNEKAPMEEIGEISEDEEEMELD